MPAALFLSLLLPYAFASVLGSVYRTVNAVIAPDLVADLQLSAEELGLLTSIFLLTYAAVQIPLGVLLDRFGARRVTAALFALAAGACVVFALATDFVVLALARAVLGVGISVSLMGGLKAMVESFPRDRMAVGNALMLMAAGLGTMAATIPVQAALQFTDWRGVFLGIAAATVLSALLLMIAPDAPRGTAPSNTAALRGLFGAVRQRPFLRLVPLASSCQGVNMALAGLWAGPWLHDVSGLSRTEAAAVLFGMAVVVSATVLLTGWAATRLQRAGMPIVTTAGIGIASFILFETLIAADVPVSPWALWLPLAFFATAPSLTYTVLAASFAPELAGRVNTAYNFTTFVVAFAAQWSMGAIIDLWPPADGGGFAPDGYKWSLAIMVGFQLCAFIWLFLAPRPAVHR